MSKTALKQELHRIGADRLLAVERKLIIGSLALGLALLAVLGLLARL